MSFPPYLFRPHPDGPAVPHRFTVVGAGFMGAQIALQAACFGFETVLYDIDAQALVRARDQLAEFAEAMIAEQVFAPAVVAEALAGLCLTNRLARAAAADLVLESVPEQLELKRRVFAEFHAACPPHTVFATNSSSLVPSQISKATGRPGQFAALHFHPLVWYANLVEVMPHAETEPRVTAALAAFAEALGQKVIVMETEHNGYVFNTMFNAFNRAALSLASRGIARIDQIDEAWLTVMRTPRGPFQQMDIVGLKTVFHINELWARLSGDPQLQRNAAFVKQYLDAARYGRTVGAGFYDYDDDGMISGLSDVAGGGQVRR